MLANDQLYIARVKDSGEPLYLLPGMANRHGLIAGATGSGKTVTLKVMAESFSDMGVPVFLSDVKGDISGELAPGTPTGKVAEHVDAWGLRDLGFEYKGYPVSFWDLWGERGIPLRTTISDMGPTLLARLMDLTPVQTDILTIIFKIADDNRLLLLDTKDLKAMIKEVSDNRRDYEGDYGNIAPQSLGVLTRSVIALEESGADVFFGEPSLDLRDWLKTDYKGKGMINILRSETLITNPLLYSTFLLWMMSELFEVLPEVGDLARPKLVFFFDEAHLLFKDAPKVLLQKIEQVVKLIRSKGVGIYFVTQNPADIPGGVLAQLGNKVQHALHAYTPAEQKGVTAAANAFRPNPAFKTQDAISNLGTGEALVSFMDEHGAPNVVQVAEILPPASFMGAADEAAVMACAQSDVLYSKYATPVDRESAYEIIEKRITDQNLRAQADKEAAVREREAAKKDREKAKEEETKRKEEEKESAAKKRRIKSAIRSTASTVGGTVAREAANAVFKGSNSTVKRIAGNTAASIGRGILGTLFK